MDYPFEQIFAADPGTPGNVAAYASILIFAPGDVNKTPLTLTKLDGSPLTNPLTTSGVGATTSFIAQIEQVAWEGGGYTGLFTSYVGMRDETELARIAAQNSATSAAASATSAANHAIPSGGTTGQVLTKGSSVDYDAAWADSTGGGGGGGSGVDPLKWSGTAWPTRPTGPMLQWFSTNDASAPMPPMNDGDMWIRHPDALES